MDKAIIFGAGGWLGARLVERLARAGRQVVAIDIRIGDQFSSLAGVEIVEGDIRDIKRFKSKFSDCAVVFNCAGLIHPGATSAIYAVNRDAPLTIYRECIDSGVKSFVHVSSINAHGDNQSATEFLDETQTLRPITHYGISKAQCELALQKMAVPEKTRLIMLRPGVFYGERPSKNLLEFMTKLQTSAMPIFAARGFVRTYVDVEKVVEAILLAEHNGRSGEAYIIGDVEPLSTLRFYQIVAGELGKAPKIVRIPLFVARICEKAAFWAGRLGVHLRIPTIVGEFGRHTYGLSTKAAQELGYQPHQSSEAGLRKMAQFGK